MNSSAEIYAKIESAGIVPVIRAATKNQAADACRALVRGGIRVLEVTLTVPSALELISELRVEFEGKALVGVGTVLDVGQAKDCFAAGAEFMVSPGLNLQVVEACHRVDVPIMPGVLTPSEVISAWQAGASCVKVFPCSALGGPKYLRALGGPLPEVKLMPTGGVNLATAEAYIAAGAVALGIGSELVDAISLSTNRMDIIEERAAEFVRVVADARRMLGKHHAA